MAETYNKDEMSQRMKGVVATVKGEFAGLRTGPIFQSDSLYLDCNRTLGSLIRQVDSMNSSPLFDSSAVYDNLNGMAHQAEGTIRDFREHPEKYLRLKVF